MIRWFRENLTDEILGQLLLRNIFRYRGHPPCIVAKEELPPEAFSGRRESLFSHSGKPLRIEPLGEPIVLSDSLQRIDFQFPSPVKSSFAESQQVICSRWSHPRQENRRVVVGVDGIVQMRDTWFRTLAETLVPAGWDIVMMDAPYNFRRTPAGYRPGQLILGGNLYHLLNVGRQSIVDLLVLVEMLQRSGESVGLTGVSFGAWMSTTVSQMVPHIQFLHAVTPPLEMSWMLREGGAIVRAVWQGLSYDHIDWTEAQELLRPLSPIHFRPHLAPEQIWFHTARYDRFVSTRRIEEYAQRLGCRVQEWPRGHIGATCRSDVAAQIGRQIRESFP
jgi:hypothetical protein